MFRLSNISISRASIYIDKSVCFALYATETTRMLEKAV